MTGRVLFHVQYLLGIGHLQRSLRIAEALVEAGIAVTLVQGGPAVPEVSRARGIDIVQLPPIRARDATFALVDDSGNPVDDALRAARRTALLAALAAAKPDAVVIEGYPFARRAFRFELDPLIAAARAAGARIICSVRDIPTVRGDPARLADIVARVRDGFDAVLVHGDADFIPFDAAFPAAPQIADRLHYTGYVSSRPDPAPGEDGPDGEVVVSVGGGAAGQALLMAALNARRRGCLAERGWRILAGAGLTDAQFEAIRRVAPSGVVVERFRRDFATLLRRCHVSVSQAGYNTVLDILAARARAVLVPFAAERETEQLIRAEHLAGRGAAVLLRESELTPAMLAAAIERAASGDPLPLAIDTDGARRSATLIAQFMVSSTYLPRAAAANSAEWPDLVVELDRWEEAGQVAQLWWRDDDAIAPTPQLDRLLALADATPLALAVIPANVVRELAAALDFFPRVTVLHHGWRHANHAADYPGAGKKSEYPAERHPVDIADELDEGRRRLVSLFGPRALPVFVPPWNRFADRFVPLLTEAGLTVLSQMAPRKGEPPGGIRVLDVHVDVVAWQADRGFVGKGPALGRLIAELRASRETGAPSAIGVLTHHLIMDWASEDFLFRLGEIVATHPAACWADMRELMVAP